jgi:hypothetical protein
MNNQAVTLQDKIRVVGKANDNVTVGDLKKVVRKINEETKDIRKKLSK